jgi:prepilin-type N-terminal cleavage/methylation domain-containing protein
MTMADCRLPMADWPRVRVRQWSAFTLIEMLVVIAIIGALAALIVGAAGIYREKSVRSRVETELRQIVGAIESYQKKFGFYPPDNGKTPNDPARPPLYYELTGTPLDPAAASGLFGVRGIVNTAPNNEQGQDFFSNLGIEGKRYRAIGQQNGRDVYALTLPLKGPDGEVNAWRYVSKNPTNNTETYDLWAEVLVGNKRIIISNWKE